MHTFLPRRGFLGLLLGSFGAQTLKAISRILPKPSSAKARTTWYMKATEMTADGRLTFFNQPWWPRARKLAEGEHFTLDLNHDGRPDTIVTRLHGNIVEAIDDSGHAIHIWNKVDTAYVVSYGGTGLVDRMVVYTDNNNDGKVDEMEIRYYKDGYLRFAWFGENYDHDGVPIFQLANWEYDHKKQFECKFRGNGMIYINKYDPASRIWTPLSECPFAFYDPNHDGLAEIALRAAVQAKNGSAGKGSDIANNYSPMWQKEPLPLKDMEIGNVRLSYNIDPEPRHDALDHPHFNFGFTMVGYEPYRFPDMYYTNPLRRPPQTTIRMAWNRAVHRSLSYPAAEVGFSWDEARDVHRWEGQFWINERRILPNTGSPTERWNMRREFHGSAADRRQVYYSDVDKRYHLFGASEMWLEVGHLVDDQKDMEIRAYDTDHDGYFDTWEIFRPGKAEPVRVTRVLDPRAHVVALDRQSLMTEYNGHILPEAISEDQKLIAEMKRFVSSPLAEQYEAAATKSRMPERQRYCLDIARELYFLKARDALYARDASGDYPTLPNAAPRTVAGAGPVDGRYTIEDTVHYWKLAGQIQKLMDDYGSGRYDKARADLEAIRQGSSGRF